MDDDKRCQRRKKIKRKHIERVSTSSDECNNNATRISNGGNTLGLLSHTIDTIQSDMDQIHRNTCLEKENSKLRTLMAAAFNSK